MSCFTPEQYNKCTLALETFSWVETANMLRQIAATPRLKPYPTAPIVRQLQNLNIIASRDVGQSKVAYEVLQKIEANDLCHELVLAMHQWRPFDKDVTELVRQFSALPVVDTSREVELERLIRITQEQFLDPVVWAKRFGPIRYRVCRVERGDPKSKAAGEGFGTAFLVARDVVLTNHHVIDPVLRGSDAANKIIFGFDRITNSDPASVGSNCGLKSPSRQETWLIAKDKDLDYALLRLDQAIGDAPIVVSSGDESGKGKAAKRGWFKLSRSGADEIKVDDSQLIIQHPKGMSLKMDIGKVDQLSETRIQYNISTMPGSSGSPCFDRELRVVALHHAGSFAFNQGILINAIVDDLMQKNVDGEVEIV